MVTKRYLLLTSALLWAFASYKILNKGIPSILADHRIWIVILAVIIAAMFIAMFQRVSQKYTLRIKDMEGVKFPIYRFMSLKGYLLIGFMMSLGIILGRIPGVPKAFFAFFYPGLGFGLLSGSIRFLINSFRQK